MTQTALLHVNKEAEKLTEQVKKYLDIFETSSPSYVFMAGMDQCVQLIKKRGDELFEAYAEKLEQFREEIKDVPHIHLLPLQNHEKMDSGKLIIAADGMNGQELADLLRKEYLLEMEMAAAGYVIALTSIADTQEGFDRLKNALIHISKTISTSFVEITEKNERMNREEIQQPEQLLTISEADKCEKEIVTLAESKDRVCGEYIYLYPPGIPLVLPGERMTDRLITEIQNYQSMGLEIQGIKDYEGKRIEVLKNVRGI